MSDVDVVRRAWAAWEQRDMDTMVECMTPDVVHDLSHYEGFPAAGVYAGIGPALQSLGEWMAWWKAYRQDLVGVEEADGRVLIVARHVGTRDGARVAEDLGLLFLVSDGRITRWEAWSDVDAARRALHGT
jgi:ketosteroid isomerase-like protein